VISEIGKPGQKGNPKIADEPGEVAHDIMRCATHPEVETTLRCSKCGAPICPKCMVQTPVGARCPKCAGLRKLPTFRISTRHLLIATATGLGIAIVYGLIWGLISSFLDFFYLNILLAAGAGYATGEVISLSVNRKRSLKLAVIAGVAVAISYLISVFPPWGAAFTFTVLHLVLDLVAVAIGIYIAVTRLR
jgi:hypothetical protein